MVSNTVQLTIPHAEEEPQEIHRVRERQVMGRRLLMSRLTTGMLTFIGVGSAAIAEHMQSQQHSDASLSSLEVLFAEQKQASYDSGYARGIRDGRKQGIDELIKTLEKLQGVADSEALASSLLFMSLHDVYISPIASYMNASQSNDAIALLLNSVHVAHDTLNADIAPHLQDVITILESWESRQGDLIKPLPSISESDISKPKTYLTKLIDTLKGKS